MYVHGKFFLPAFPLFKPTAAKITFSSWHGCISIVGFVQKVQQNKETSIYHWITSPEETLSSPRCNKRRWEPCHKALSIVSSSQFSGNVSWSAASTHSSLSRSRLHVLSLKCHVLMYNSFLEDMFGLDRHHPSLKVEEIIGRNRKPNPRSIRRIRSYDTAGVIRARRSICCVDNEPWAPSYVHWMLYDWQGWSKNLRTSRKLKHSFAWFLCLRLCWLILLSSSSLP